MSTKKCEHDKKIILIKEYGIAYNQETQQEYPKREDLKNMHCNKICDTKKQYVCDLLSQISR